jgi:hypothetical protein
MKRVHPPIQNQELPTHTPFFNKESDQPFFSNGDSFFPKTSIQTKSDQEGEQEDEGIGAEKLVQKLSAPVAGTDDPGTGSSDKLAVQTKCSECEKEDQQKEKEAGTLQRKGEDEADTPTQAAVPATNTPVVALFLVDDNALPGATQMRKSAFLDRLKMEVCDTVNQALAGTPFSSDKCPYIQASFARHQNSSPVQIEALIKRYNPDAAKAQSAEELIQQMKVKVYASALQWAKTGGDMSGVTQVFGGIADGINSVAGSVASGVGSIAGGIASGIGNIASGIGNMLFKENAGGATATQTPQAIVQSLGTGNSIEGGTRSKMESAFGTSFSDVQIHTDSHAAELSRDMNARAFTVGNHIAFAGNEYQPGTLTGEALMAHELAHTIQQDNGKAGNTQMKGGSEYSALEEDADQAAVGAMVKGYGGKDDDSKIKKNKGIRTGLRLSRCKDCGTTTPAKIDDPKKYPTYEAWLASFPPHSGIGDKDITAIAPPALRELISPTDGGFSCDCADVSLLLKHYYLKVWDKNLSFRSGPGEGEQVIIGKGVSDDKIRKLTAEIGTINFQEDRGGKKTAPTSMVSFYKNGMNRVTNLKMLIDMGLKSGDLFAWKRLEGITGNFEGHVQTVQSVDPVAKTITFVQGNMSQGKGVGKLEQRQESFMKLTGAEDGNANILNKTEESFWGAGPWIS